MHLIHKINQDARCVKVPNYREPRLSTKYGPSKTTTTLASLCRKTIFTIIICKIKNIQNVTPSPRPLLGQSTALPSAAPALDSPLSRSRRRRASRFLLLRSHIRQSSWWGTGHRWGLECLSPRPSASAEQPWPAVVSRLNLCPETFSCPAPPKPGKGGWN